MTTTFIISEPKLREFTDLNEMVDTALIKNAIREAQDISLQSIIGTKLYEAILDKIDTDTLTGDYKHLVDAYIQNFLLYAAYYEALDAIYLRPRNNGLLIPTGGENSQNVDRTMYNAKRQSVQNKMEFYAQKLSQYINQEMALFPELNSADKLYQQWPDYGDQFRSPIVFNQGTRSAEHYRQAVAAGLRIADSRYPQFPWGSNINWK